MSLYEPNEIDTAMKSFIAETEAEFAAAPDAPTSEAPVAEATPEQPVISGEPQPNTVETPADPSERGLERLVAREVELRERENRLAGTEKEMEALRTYVRDLEARAFSPELLDKIKLSPTEGLKALGLDPDEVVRQALVEKLGDKANTPEMREVLERTRIRKEMESMREQIRQNEYARAAQDYFNKIASGASTYVRDTDGLAKHAPVVASVAKSNPERVYQEIMEEITRDATARRAQDPHGDPITYEEASKRVETRWNAMRALLGTPNPAAPASTPKPNTPVVAKPDVKTPPVTAKPPEKPIAPWLQRNTSDEEAINAAILAYKQSESKR